MTLGSPKGRRRHGRLALLAALCALVLLAPASAHAAKSLPFIISPSQNGLVRGASVTVKVRIASGAGNFRASIDGKDISGLFKGNGSTRTARVRAGGAFRPGIHHVFVKTGSGNSETADENTFFLGRPSSPVLQTLSSPLTTSSAPNVVARTLPGSTFRARLNGRHVHGSFRDRNGTRSAVLGANNGLKFGRNRLVMLAWKPDGTYDREVHEIVVPRDRPLPGARGPGVAVTGTALTLSGLSSQSSRRGARLAYSWKLLSAAKGAKTRLNGATTSKPRLTTNRPGLYKLQLSVRERLRGRHGFGKAATEVVTVPVRATQSAVGLPVQTCADPGCRLLIGGNDPVVPTAAQPITLVTLDRDTGAATNTSRYADSVADMNKLQSDVAGLGKDTLAVLWGSAGLKGGGLSQVDAAAKALGAKPLNRAFLVQGAPFSVIGAKGWAEGNAHQDVGLKLGSPGHAPGPAGNIEGYLQVNPLTSRYTFVRGDFPSFDTQVDETATSNKITLRGTTGTTVTHAATLPANGKAGFQVLVLNDQTLEPITDGSKVFAVNTTDGKDAQNQAAMATTLKDLLDGQITKQSVFFIQTIGHPNVTTPTWQQISDQLKRIGGTNTAIDELDGTRGYALVGRPDGNSVESRQTAPIPAPPKPAGRVGALTGLLNRNRQSHLEPALADPSADVFNTEFTQVAYQTPTDWPQRDTPGKRNAIAYLIKQLKPVLPGTDPKDSYTNRSNDSHWDGFASQAMTVPYPDAAHGFSKADLRAVQSELRNEFSYVAEVVGFINSIRKPLTDAGIVSQGSLAKVSSEIIDKVSIDRRHALLGAGPATEILGLGMEFFAAFAPHDFKEHKLHPAFEAFSIALIIAGIAMEGTEQHGEDPGEAVLGRIRTEVGNAAGDLAERYLQSATAIEFLRDVFVTDYGKLKEAATRAADTKNPNWQVPTARAAFAITAAYKQWFYARLLPIPYVAWDLGQISPQKWYMCLGGSPPKIVGTYDKTPASAQQMAISGIVADQGGIRRVPQWLAIGRDDTWDHSSTTTRYSRPPPAEFTDRLFGTPSPDDTSVSNLGADKLAFFMNNFQRPASRVAYKAQCR